MEKWSNVHLMFCEGPHDAAFLNRLLRKQLGFTKVELKLSELPYPISNVIQQSFKTRAAEDLRLDLAKKFFLPDYIVTLDRVLVMVFNYGGSNRKANMSPFLENVFALLSAPVFAGIGQPASSAKFAYTIFADADAIGLTAARAKISADLATIGDSVWLNAAWLDFEGTTAVSQESAFGQTAAYIWKKWAEDNGTLEDIVQECLVDEPGLQQTLQFLDTRFNWSAPVGATPKEVCAIASKRLKAAFCVEGQREKPGMSLGVVLDQTALLRPEVIAGSAAVQDCVTFLRAWLTPGLQVKAA
jgi:hypothetical protein